MVANTQHILPPFMGEEPRRGDGGLQFSLSQYESLAPIERQEAPTSPVNGGRKVQYDQN